VNHGDLHIPYDMKCADCQHIASHHWYSGKGKLWSGDCQSCIDMDGTMFPYPICREFKWDNLNYVEALAEHREWEKSLI
jgi:hypothetical protein